MSFVVLDGVAVRRRRLSRGLTQVEVAQLAGFDHKTMSRIEQEKPIQLASLRRLCRVLGVGVRSRGRLIRSVVDEGGTGVL